MAIEKFVFFFNSIIFILESGVIFGRSIYSYRIFNNIETLFVLTCIFLLICLVPAFGLLAYNMNNLSKFMQINFADFFNEITSFGSIDSTRSFLFAISSEDFKNEKLKKIKEAIRYSFFAVGIALLSLSILVIA